MRRWLPILMISTVSALPADAAPQMERWDATSTTARSITGDVRFSPNRIRFQTGAALPLKHIGTIPVKKSSGRAGEAALYKVIKPSSPTLLMGNTLCGREPVTYLAVSPIGRGGRSLAAFLGEAPPKHGADGSCAIFSYDVP